MISRPSLETAGYRQCRNPMQRDDWNAWLFQKRFNDKQGTRYFIDVMEYDWQQFAHRLSDTRFSYEPHVTIYTGNGDASFRMIVQDDAACASIEGLEIFVENIWTKLGAGYYEIW